MDTRIRAAGKAYRQLNAEVRQALAEGATRVVLEEVNGQYYIGAGLQGCWKLAVTGTAGNDTACYLDGPEIVIHGSAQDGLGNTMNDGLVVVHGGCGDVVGYGMRGGEIFVRDRVGYRVGIHMKEYKDKCPLIVIGGNTGAFLGEYMAGGRIVVLGLNCEQGEVTGRYCGSGMHGGCIYLRDMVGQERLSPDVVVQPLTEVDRRFLNSCIERYCRFFNLNSQQLSELSFIKLVPRGNRPYARLYVGA